MSDLICLKAAALELGRTYAGLRRYAAEGRIPAQREGCHWMVDLGAVREALSNIKEVEAKRKRQAMQPKLRMKTDVLVAEVRSQALHGPDAGSRFAMSALALCDLALEYRDDALRLELTIHEMVKAREGEGI